MLAEITFKNGQFFVYINQCRSCQVTPSGGGRGLIIRIGEKIKKTGKSNKN